LLELAFIVTAALLISGKERMRQTKSRSTRVKRTESHFINGRVAKKLAKSAHAVIGAQPSSAHTIKKKF
jgi:hypothetical protein